MCIRKQKEHMCTLKILLSMSEYVDYRNTKVTQQALKVGE